MAFFHRESPDKTSVVYTPRGEVRSRNVSEIDKRHKLKVFERHVSEYTRRKLSYEEDSLQAVSSILKRFSQPEYRYCWRIFHICGMPFVP
jgi:hypothetical protein